MRAFLFFFCTTAFSFSSLSTFSQEKIVIDSDQTISVYQVFKIVKNQTDYRFIYPKTAFENFPNVSLAKGEIQLGSLLEKCFKGSNYVFELTENKNILVKKKQLFEISKDSQEFVVSGVIKDHTGNPLPGASIIEKGTTNGTQTDFDGNFSLTVQNENAILVVSYVGYESQEIQGFDNSPVAVSLKEDAAKLDEVVLVGYKGQAVEVINAKRRAVQIADFLSQDNIGRLPDFAAADAARRIVGVNTVFDEDEATQVGLRGLPPIYTFATIDGLSIPSADRNTRVANFEVIPSFSVAKIEVYKSRTADLDGNAIGGLFNLKTRSAYDNDHRIILVNASVGIYDFNDVPRSSRNNASKNGISNRFDFTFANQLGADNKFGVVFSLSTNRKDRDELKSPRANFNSLLNDDPNKPIPSRLRINSYDNVINRYGGFLKLEYKPNDKFYASISGSHFVKIDNEIRYESRLDKLAFDENSITKTGGRFTAGRSRLAHDIFEIEHKLSNVIFDAYYKFNEKSKWDVKFGAATGFRGEEGPNALYRTGTDSSISGSYNVNENRLFYELDNPAFYSDFSNYNLASIAGFTRVDDEDFTSFSTNYSYNRESDSNGWGFKLGYKFRVLNHLFDQDGLSLSYTGDNALQLNQFILDEPFQPTNIIGQRYPLFDPYALNDFISANSSSFELPSNSIGTKFHRGIVDQPQNQFNVKETINAFYGLIGYSSERFNFSAGLRYEDTKTLSSTPRQVNGEYVSQDAETNNDFGHLLPSLSLTYDFADEVKFKAAYSKALGRADYGQLAPGDVIDEANNEVSRGNPNLKPRRSDNFDTSVEYYFEGGSLFSLGVFHKNIKDDIQTESSFEGQTEIFTPVNINGFAVTGIELNFIKNDFDFLPGFLSNFGVSSNYAFIIGERFLNDGTNLASNVNLPRNSINVLLFYQTKKWDSRLAWNWVDQTLRSVRSSGFDQHFADRHQLDWNGNVKLTEKLSLFSEIRNLTNANRTFLGGPGQAFTEEVTEYGRSFWLGLNYKF
jgi:TonB-dependent receptor